MAYTFITNAFSFKYVKSSSSVIVDAPVLTITQFVCLNLRYESRSRMLTAWPNFVVYPTSWRCKCMVVLLVCKALWVSYNVMHLRQNTNASSDKLETPRARHICLFSGCYQLVRPVRHTVTYEQWATAAPWASLCLRRQMACICALSLLASARITGDREGRLIPSILQQVLSESEKMGVVIIGRIIE